MPQIKPILDATNQTYSRCYKSNLF